MEARKCAYGLADASLYWQKRVKQTVLTAGGEMSQADPAVFYWLDACRVDDFIWGTHKVSPHH